MLFDEYKYFDYQFPELQYFGVKHVHLSWLNCFFSQNSLRVLDAFSGLQSVRFLFLSNIDDINIEIKTYKEGKYDKRSAGSQEFLFVSNQKNTLFQH
jgi:hypothetical protein